MLEDKSRYYKVRNKLFGFLLTFFLIWYINTLIPIEGEIHNASYRIRIGYIMYILTGIIGAIITVKYHRNITKKDFITSIILGSLSSGGMNIIVGGCTFLVYLGSVLLLKKYPPEKNLIYSDSRKELTKDLFIVIGAVIFLSIFHILPGVLFRQWRLKPTLIDFPKAMIPGISEEVIFRLFFYSIIRIFMQGEPSNSLEKFWIYVVLIVPHIITHHPDTFVKYGLLAMIGPFITLLLITFTITHLFLKRNLITAIGVHFLLDYLFFVVVQK